jgi:hypothetical protein
MDTNKFFHYLNKKSLIFVIGFFSVDKINAVNATGCTYPTGDAVCGQCAALVWEIHSTCEKAAAAAHTAAANLAAGVNVADVDTSMTAIYGSEGSTAASGGFANDCNGKTMKANDCIKTQSANPTGGFNAAKCEPSIQKMGQECQAKQASAVDALAKLNQTKATFGSMLSKAAPYLVGAAVGAGAMALLNKKKGGGGNNDSTKKEEPKADDDKLKPLNTSGTGSSSSSSSSGPNIVYYDKGTPNNNGSLGNPAVTSSSTTTKPSDAVTVASITPSSSFGSGQSSSSDGLDSNGTRTLSSGSGMNSLSGGSSGGGGLGSGSGGSEGGSESNSAAGSLVDASKAGSGGSSGATGGMDSSGGGGGGAQVGSADGTMMTGIPGGKDKDSLKKKKALVKKNTKATSNPSNLKQQSKLSTQSGKRRIANAKQAPATVKSENLLQSFQKRGLLNRGQTSPKP